VGYVDQLRELGPTAPLLQPVDGSSAGSVAFRDRSDAALRGVWLVSPPATSQRYAIGSLLRLPASTATRRADEGGRSGVGRMDRSEAGWRARGHHLLGWRIASG